MDAGMWKDFSQGYQKDLAMKEEQVQIMLDEVDRYKREKKEAMTILKNRDIELQRANQKIIELQKLNTDFQIMQSKLMLSKDSSSIKPGINSALQSKQVSGQLEPITRPQGGIKLPEISRPSS